MGWVGLWGGLGYSGAGHRNMGMACRVEAGLESQAGGGKSKAKMGRSRAMLN